MYKTQKSFYRIQQYPCLKNCERTIRSSSKRKKKNIKINQVCEEDNFDQSIFENWSPQIAEKKRENLKTLIRTICDLAYNRGSNVPSDYDVFQGQTYQSFGLTRAYAQGI